MKKYKIGYTTGVFDLFHIGHLNILRRAKEQCDYLIVGVTTDELCHQRKNKYPIMKQHERMDIVSAIRYVDKVIKQSDMEKIKPIIEFKCDVVFVGSDWQGSPAWNEYEKQFKAVGCDVVYLTHTDGVSSTIISKILDKIYNDQYN